MFLWCDVHLGGSSLFNELSQKAQSNATTTEPLHQSDIELETIDTLFTLLADDGVRLFRYFIPNYILLCLIIISNFNRFLFHLEITLYLMKAQMLLSEHMNVLLVISGLRLEQQR